jgi:uncharacterized membrane protein
LTGNNINARRGTGWELPNLAANGKKAASMRNSRDEIVDWVEQGRIQPENLRFALDIGGALPVHSDWRGFLDRFLLWAGVLFVVAGAIFFFAYNWDSMGRYAKFALAEAAIVAALAFVWWRGLDRVGGRAALFAAALFVGALFALIGQIYQTGADTFELFAVWAAAILPWVIVARWAALWIVWIALLNIAIALYFHTMGGIFGLFFDPVRQFWILFALNTVALVIWEALAAVGVEWLRDRWAARVLATTSGGLVTALALYGIFDSKDAGGFGVPVWLAWLGCAYFVYRHRISDIYVLAGAVLSVIVVVSSFLAKHLLGDDAAFAFLLIGVIVIVMSAAGGWWLKDVASREAA